MKTGTVVAWGEPGSGTYGFIQDAEGREYFVHESDVAMEGFRELVVGTEVRFAVRPGTDFPRAIRVRPVRYTARPTTEDDQT